MKIFKYLFILFVIFSFSVGNVEAQRMYTYGNSIGTSTNGANFSVNATLGTAKPATWAASTFTTGGGALPTELPVSGWWFDPAGNGGLGSIKHVSGATTTLISTDISTTISPIVAYQMVITGTGGTATCSYTLGGSTGTTLPASGSLGISDYITPGTATADVSFVITPGNTSTIEITAIAVKAMADATGDLTVGGNLIVRSPMFAAFGQGTRPMYSFLDSPTSGMSYYTSALRFMVSGTNIFSLSSTAATIAGAVAIGSTSAGKNLTVNATLGSELITWDETGWDEDGAWTFAGGVLTHVTGNTTAVTGTITGALTVGATYAVHITGTGGGDTATYTVGGVTGTTIAASGAIDFTDYITATANSELVITPANTCTVALTLVSVKLLTDATGDATVQGDLFVGSSIKSPGGTTGGMRFLPNGNIYSVGDLGINTLYANANLSTGKAGWGDTGKPAWLLYDGGFTTQPGGNGYFAGFYFDLPNSNNMSMITHHGGSIVFGRHTTLNVLGTITEWMRILNNGNIGVRTTAPDTPLEVNSATGLGIRVTYNDSNGSAANHGDLTVGATGDVTLTATGTNPNIVLTPAGTGQVKNTAANITVGATGTSVSTGHLNRQVYVRTYAFGDFTDVDTTKGIVIATLPAKTKIVGIYADTTAQYTGGTVNACTLEVGITAEGAAQILEPHNVFAAAILAGDAEAELGTSMIAAGRIQNGYMPSWTGTTAIYATLDSTAGNLNALTTGSTTFYIETERY